MVSVIKGVYRFNLQRHIICYLSRKYIKMKNLLTLFVVLTAFAAGAQTVTEKSLMGMWNPAYVVFMGSTYTVATGEITLSKEAEDIAIEQGGDPADFKVLLAENLGMLVENIALEFKPGQVLQLNEAGEISTTTYAISPDGKITSVEPAEEYTFVVKDKYLELLSDDGQLVIGFEKAK